MKYFYSAAVMGYGPGRWWHKFYNFPDLIRVTKTLTLDEKVGYPFCVLPIGKSVWNKVSLHNIGFIHWVIQYNQKDLLSKTIVSIAGHRSALNSMIQHLNMIDIAGIEINYSCPNHTPFTYVGIDLLNFESRHPLYLKLRYDDNPYKYDLDKIDGIRLNSVPAFGGGMSGKYAQKYNWHSIKNWIKDGINVAGCSFTCMDDIKRLEDMGCKEIGIGSTIITNPSLVELLKND